MDANIWCCISQNRFSFRTPRTNKGYKDTSFADDEKMTCFKKHRGELTGIRNKHCCNDAQKVTHFYNMPSANVQKWEPKWERLSNSVNLTRSETL